MSVDGGFGEISLEQILSDPTSNGNVHNILDVITALIWDCNFQSAKNSKAIQSFVQRFSDVAGVIHSQRTKYSDFELIKVIGQGGFGRVQLMRHKNTRRVYAMKMMSKQHLLDHSQSGYWEERDIMVKAASEWLVACHQAFVDKENIYLCMEYMPGGDLYYWLECYDTFTEEQARFYLAETVLALEALHNLGYIHRDLKPDNMLLDGKGHLKLADFGSCVRMNPNGVYFCASPIGTPDYISPEMLNCQSKPGNIGPECDWWALGVIAFEMLFGETAFYGQSLVETYSRILSHEKSLKIPTDTEITPAFEQLIRDFLRPANIRLGSRSPVSGEPGGANAVKAHAFFAAVDWCTLRQSNPPIQPVVTSEVDTSNINFDDSELAASKFGAAVGNGPSNLPRSAGALAPKRPAAPTYFTGENLAFAGFTFDRDVQIAKDSEKNSRTKVDQKSAVASLAEMKLNLQAAERQIAVDKVALKEVQNRLVDAQAELQTVSKSRSDVESTLKQLRSQYSALETERDTLIERVSKTQIQLSSVTNDLEVEHRTSISTREELANLIRLKEDLEVSLSLATEELKLRAVAVAPSPPTIVANEKPRAAHEGGEDTEARVEFEGLKESLDEARQQLCQANAELAVARRLHADEIGDLSDQLQVSKNFADLYKSQLAESEDDLTLLRKKEDSLLQELATLKSELEVSLTARNESKDKIFKLESSLAVSRVELAEAQKNFHSELKEAQSQANRHRQIATSKTAELETLTSQRVELMEHCKSLEANVSTLTEQLNAMRSENAIQRVKLDETIRKLTEVATNIPVGSKRKGKTVDNNKISLLQRQFRNAASSHQQEVSSLQATIDRLKMDSNEKADVIAQLTQTKSALEAELNKAHMQINELYEWLDYKPGSGSSGTGPRSVSGANAAPGCGDISAHSSPTGTLLDAVSMSLSLESLHSLHPDRIMMRPQYMTPVEGICDFPVKGRGRHKLAWLPRYIVISTFSVSFYSSREQREQIGSSPIEEIKVCKIFSIRHGTMLDLNYATTDDASRLICIVSDEMVAPSGNGTEAGDTTVTNRTIINSTVVSNAGSTGSGSASGIISWHGHSFQPMTFRILNTMCEVCRRPCSDLISPPPALECVRCRMRIHRHHVECHEKFVVCPNTVRQWLIRAPSVEARREWVTKISQLRSEAGEVRRTADGFVSPAASTANFGGSLSSSTRYRSMRNFPNFNLRETPSRRSIAVPTTLPRTLSTPGTPQVNPP